MATRGRPQDFRTIVEDQFDRVWRRIRELERPDGSQLFNALAKVQELISNLPGQVAAATTAFLSSGFTTGEMHSTGNISTDASVIAAGGMTATSGINSVDVYNRIVTGSGSYHYVYANQLGQLGQVPSSQRFKQDVIAADLSTDLEALFSLTLRWFRYTQAVDELGDDAPAELGLIAEEIDALGLTWLVEYGEDGEPFSINRDRLVIAVLAMVQSERAARLTSI